MLAHRVHSKNENLERLGIKMMQSHMLNNTDFKS